MRQGRPGTPWSARGLVLVIDTMLVGVGGVFIATRSVLVTTIAAVSALALTAVILRAAPAPGGRGDEDR